MKKIVMFVFILSISMTLQSCMSTYEYVEGKVNIVATTTMLGDLSRQIGGDKVSVTTLMGVGVDPHLYSAKASDTNALDKSDFIIFGGLHLEGKMVDILEILSKEKASVNSGELVRQAGGKIITDDKGNADPHVWFNVNNWITVTKALTKELIKYDKDNETYYQNRSDAYVIELQELDIWINQRVQELESEQRVLVTAHDAFAYFADAYGFEVESIQGISTESEPSITEINNLVNLVVDRDIKAIFIETSVPQKTIDSVIASAKNRGYTLLIGGELYSDSLGDGIYGTFIEAFKKNVNTIVDALK